MNESWADPSHTDGALSTAAMGRLMAVLFVLSGAVTALYPLLPTPPGFHATAVVLIGVAAIAVGTGYWWLPWGRWSQRTALLAGAPIAHALIALHNYYGGADPYRYCLYFMVVYVWIGLAQPRWTAVRVAPMTVVAYLAPLVLHHSRTVALVSVSYAVVMFVLIGESVAWVSTDLQRAQRSLTHQAFHDPLTGLANRALFVDRLQHAVELRRRDGRPVTVLFLDLDDFKSVNDTFGHAGGDTVLRAVADRLCSAVRPSDTLARMGGDEFAALLESPVGDPLGVGERVRSAVEQPYDLADRSVTVGCSVGVATTAATGEPIDAADLLQHADSAMYDAKASGKNTVRLYSPATASGGDRRETTAP